MTYPCLLGAVVLTSANNRIRITSGATTYDADVAVGTYYLREDDTSDDLNKAIRTALNATADPNTYACLVSRSINSGAVNNTFTISRAAGANDFSIIRDGTQTFDYDLLGYSVTTAHNASAKTSDKCPGALWVSNDGFKKFTRRSRKIVGSQMTASGRLQQVSRSDRLQEYFMQLQFVHASRLFIDEALNSDQWNTLEAFIDRFGPGSAIEIHDLEINSGVTLLDTSASTRLATAQWAEETLAEFDPQLIGQGIDLYDIPLSFHKKV